MENEIDVKYNEKVLGWTLTYNGEEDTLNAYVTEEMALQMLL